MKLLEFIAGGMAQGDLSLSLVSTPYRVGAIQTRHHLLRLENEGGGHKKITCLFAEWWALPEYNNIYHFPNSKLYAKEPRYKETSVQRTFFASALTLRYIEVPLYLFFTTEFLSQKV